MVKDIWERSTTFLCLKLSQNIKKKGIHLFLFLIDYFKWEDVSLGKY